MIPYVNNTAKKDCNKMKKIAVINDLSGFGRCSLTAAISVISAMGVQPCPLPTAILTAQTGYPSYYLDDYTEKMEHFRTEWKKMGQSFDGIYTGFVAGKEQILQILRFIDTFDTPETFLLVDPVMGDDGIKYDMFTPELLTQMKRLAKRGNIITPNLTELCLLTDTDFHHIQEISDTERLMDTVQTLALSFCKEGPEHVIVTGIHFTDTEGTLQMGNLYVSETQTSLSAFPYIGKSYSGTGDLFASCLAAGIAKKRKISEIIQVTGEFLEASIEDSVRENVPRNDGVNYEKFLWMLQSVQSGT